MHLLGLLFAVPFFGLLVVYLLSQVLHIVADAWTFSANVNTRWQSVSHYVDSNASKLITQLVLSVGLFCIVMENPTYIDKLGFIGVKTGYGLMLFGGWFVDSLLAKVLGLWGLKKEV